MKNTDVNIRDPYVLLHEGVYYLYGTRSSSCWGQADGFDCYKSEDLENWDGPFEVFHRPDGFFADRNYWAPECIFRDGGFRLITTLASENRKKGVYVLAADSPLGPFKALSDKPLTPAEWNCIDGSVFEDADGRLWLLFSRCFEDNARGDMMAVELKADFSGAQSEPILLFSALDAPWSSPVPFAKAEFGMDGDVYFSDGPCIHKMADGGLIMLWSSWSARGYAVGAAKSSNGMVSGPWTHLPEPLFPENGGHGMVFCTKDGQYFYAMHYPNDRYMERPVFRKLKETNDRLELV